MNHTHDPGADHAPDEDGCLHDVCAVNLCLDRAHRNFRIAIDLDTCCLTPLEIHEAATAIMNAGQVLQARGLALFAERN